MLGHEIQGENELMELPTGKDSCQASTPSLVAIV
jgi:hypothetical protein